jgi:hypothetical protein
MYRGLVTAEPPTEHAARLYVYVFSLAFLPSSVAQDERSFVAKKVGKVGEWDYLITCCFEKMESSKVPSRMVSLDKPAVIAVALLLHGNCFFCPV